MVRYAAESGSGLSYRDATGTNAMAETVPIDNHPSVAEPVSRPRSRKPATVSASALALHLDCSRTYIGKLEAEGVIQRQGDGFPLDQSRVAYLRYLRRERQQSPRAAADAEHASAKAALLRIRIEEKRKELVSRDAHEAMIDQMAGLVLTKLSGWPARIAGADLGLRRRAEAVLHELRAPGTVSLRSQSRCNSQIDCTQLDGSHRPERCGAAFCGVSM
jgi:hypothetical protein